MNYQDTKLKMRALGLPFDPSHYNRVVPHNKGETLKHFMLKAVLVYCFIKRGESAFTEIRIGRGIFDVFNLDHLICYEVETKPASDIYEKKFKLLQGYQDRIDIIILKTRDFSEDINHIFREIAIII